MLVCAWLHVCPSSILGSVSQSGFERGVSLGVILGVSVPFSVLSGGACNSIPLPLSPPFNTEHEHRPIPTEPAEGVSPGSLWQGTYSGTTHDLINRIQSQQVEVRRGRSNCGTSVACGHLCVYAGACEVSRACGWPWVMHASLCLMGRRRSTHWEFGKEG